MAPYFSAEAIATLTDNVGTVRQRCDALREAFIMRPFKNTRAREYVHHGFCRRIDILADCVTYVFNLLPPEQDEIPDGDNVTAATIFIQSFVINTLGCLDNLAWVWVYEKNYRETDGSEIDPKSVGLGPRYSHLRRQFSPEFTTYLKGNKRWFKHLITFRDTLAHRIPLYVPPYIVPTEKMASYRELEKKATETVNDPDPKKGYEDYAQYRAEQKNLAVFRPWMTHSPTERSPIAVFHYQLLQDFATVEEFGRKMLEELDRARPDLIERYAAFIKRRRNSVVIVGLLTAVAVLIWHLSQ
jgi:hypothetical protein